VYAKGLRYAEIEERDYALLTIRFENGVLAHLEGSWAEPPNTFYTTVEIAATNGMLEYDMREVKPLVFTSIKPEPGKQVGVVVPEMPLLESPYMTELRYVVDAIRKGDPAPVPIAEALPALEVVEAALESLRTGEPVEFSTQGGSR
jgi:predicted dehydrogenase